VSFVVHGFSFSSVNSDLVSKLAPTRPGNFPTPLNPW
jgi:hypothetical protein